MMARINNVILISAYIALIAGCTSVGLSRPSLNSPRVIVPLENPQMVNASVICVVPFDYKSNISRDWSKSIAESYVRSIQARNIGASIRFFDTVRDFMLNRKTCHLLLEGSIDRIVITGGAQPQEISVYLKIKDLTTERVIFSVLQEGISRPGKDLDLYWTVVSGDTALSLNRLVDLMAEQFAKFLMDEVAKASRKSF